MSSRDQFLKTVNHQQSNRVVLDFGATAVSGIHVETLSKLRRHYGLQRKPIRIIEPYQMLGEVGWELIDSIGIDIIGAWGKNNRFGFHNHAPFKEWKTPWGQRVMLPSKFNTSGNSTGDVLMHLGGDTSQAVCATMPKTAYEFESIEKEPEDKTAKIELTIPDLISETDLEHWRVEVDKAYFSGKAVIADFGGTSLGNIPELYQKKSIQFDKIKIHLERLGERAIENLKRIFAVLGNKVNAVVLCDTNFGTEKTSYSSAEQFDAFYLPYYKQLNEWIHENTQWKTFKHSKGIVDKLLESFVKAGFDIINPVETFASGLPLEKLKEKFGKDLVFWGGGIDTRTVLPFGKPEDVRAQVLNNCEILSKNGGFVFSPVNNIPPNVPVENMVALFEAIKEFNGK
ncbi:uroporphyrinogen decarboxylase family protein [uncultured Draconibacterium sp.]|uniref:uroporphyrinogen decarboxylase family protein n=1 Tax=uncultured Draconibacterium sp. TaxID=1573823 RepID=UPI00321728EF